MREKERVRERLCGREIVFAREIVCVLERLSLSEGEWETVFARERERDCVCLRERERESGRNCVSVRKRESESDRESVFAWESGSEREREIVFAWESEILGARLSLRERESEREIVFAWERERENERELVLYNCGRIFFILWFFVGYILFFGLVRLRTIRLSARVAAHIECKCSCTHGEDVTISDVIIKTPDRKWRHARKRWAEDLGWFLEKKAELRFEAGWFLSWARPVQLGLRDAPHVVRLDGTVSIVKIVSLSPRVENLNLKKVIKVPYLNYRESSVFRVFFGIPIDIRTCFTYQNISHIRVMDISDLYIIFEGHKVS